MNKNNVAGIHNDSANSLSRFPRLMAVCLVGSLSLFASPGFAEDHIEWVGANSGINWTTGQVTAEGAGLAKPGVPPAAAKLLSCRAAVVDAQRNLLESIQGVRINSATQVTDLMLESDIIKTSVEGLLQGATIVKRSPQDDGSCLVQMTAPLSGEFSSAVYNVVMTDNIASQFERQKHQLETRLTQVIDDTFEFFIPSANAADGQSEDKMNGNATAPWESAIQALSQRISTLEELLTTHPAVIEATDTGPTGLVIDARGSNFIPSMTPKIRKIRAGVLYPNKQHQDDAKQRGQLVSLFTRDPETAKRHPIVGERPVVLKALRTFGTTRTEIVLGSESSLRLEGLIKEGFLQDAGVIIVL